MKLIFCGDRGWKDASIIYSVMGTLRANLGFFTVIEGEANGADLLSRGAAEQLHLPVEPYAANWEKYGKAAGVIRNSEQLKAGACGVVAFHAHLANSKGTKDMVDKALKAGLPVWTYEMGLDRLMPFIIELTARMS